MRAKLAEKEQLPKENLENMVASVQLEEDKRDEIQKRIQEALETDEKVKGVYCYEREYKKYKEEEPIYIEEEDGRIVTLNQHSKLQMDLSVKHGYGIYAILSELKKQGLEEEKIAEVQAIIEEYQNEEIKPTRNKLEKSRINMLQTRHGGQNYEQRLNEFFDEEER